MKPTHAQSVQGPKMGSRDPIRPWFEASEDLGDHIGIRFGRIPPGSSEVEWVYKSHADYDGIGGFADILRSRGACMDSLPLMPHERKISWGPFFKSLPLYALPRRRIVWDPPFTDGAPSRSDRPSETVAWHVFDEMTTINIRLWCRRNRVTVNSLLLSALSSVVQRRVSDKTPFIPWMVPVNVRGKVIRKRDTENHTTYVRVVVEKGMSPEGVHGRVYRALSRGEQWANWLAYTALRAVSRSIKRHIIKIDRVTSQWMAGVFSNIGVWDDEGSLTGTDIDGDWLFAPPPMLFFKIASGCVTWRGRLSLCMQLHPELSTDPAVTREWVSAWKDEILVLIRGKKEGASS